MFKGNFFLLNAVVLMGAWMIFSGAILQPEGSQRVIKKTQTDPISFKAKSEEIKDGPKGAPLHEMEYYGHGKFLTDLPMEKDKPEWETKDPYAHLPRAGDPIPEDLGDKKTSETDDWWFEDWDEEADSNDQELVDFGI